MSPENADASAGLRVLWGESSGRGALFGGDSSVQPDNLPTGTARAAPDAHTLAGSVGDTSQPTALPGATAVLPHALADAGLLPWCDCSSIKLPSGTHGLESLVRMRRSEVRLSAGCVVLN